ncbi:MAG: amidohydrolase [Jatrophihabitans sp.]
MATLLRNGRIYSPSVPAATALLIDGATVSWLGDEATAAGIRAELVVDLAGALVVPGFVDAHFHATATGLALSGLDLSPATSLAEALASLERSCRASGGRPVLGGGWDETGWPERRPPTAAELDRASYGGVVYLARTDAHSAIASSALMAAVPGLAELAGYSRTGHLTKDAHHAAREVALATISAGRRAQLHETALRHASSLGVLAVHEMAGPEISSADDLAALLELAGADESLPAVYGYWGELRGVATARELGAVGAGGDLFCDGSIGSHTAGLHQPYADDGSTSGYLRYETAELAEHILACTEAGLQAGFHAIGDAATDQVVQAMLLAADRLGARVPAAGHRIEHAELLSDVASLATAGLTASVQPAFDATWGGPDGMYAQRLGPDRARRLNPLAALAAAGVPLALGSDSPVTPIDPWGAVRAAAYPRHAEHAISARAALAAHCQGGWQAARAGGDGSGVLAPGNPASYAIFATGAPDAAVPAGSANPASSADSADSVDRPGLPDLAPGRPLPRCLRTVLRGRQLYDSGELA